MKIGFYFSHISIQYGGIYQYALLLLKMLSKVNYIDRLYIFYSSDQQEIIKTFKTIPHFEPVLYEKRTGLKEFLRRTANYYLNRYYLTGRKNPIYLRIYKLLNPDIRFFNRFQIQLFFVPMQLSPVYHLKVPVVITMHDLQHFHFPEFFTPEERMYKSISYYIALNESQHIVVSYSHVKDDIIKYFRIKKQKISVCTPPDTEDWNYKEPEIEWKEVQEKYGIRIPYFLTPAATWPHKNHMAVLKAMKILLPDNPDLFWVATGKKSNYFEKTLKPAIQEFGLEKHVLFTGMVTDEELYIIYQNARMVVIPTLYEAGSGPLFESMRFGIPVICSHATTLPEHMGNNKFVFDPNDIDQLAEKMLLLWKDGPFRDENIKHIRERYNYFAQLDYPGIFEAMFRKVISGG